MNIASRTNFDYISLIYRRILFVCRRILANKWTYLIIFLLVLFLAWMGGRPSGSLKVYLIPDISNDLTKNNLANKIFNGADAAIDDAKKYYQILSFDPNDNRHTVTIPERSGPNQFEIRDFIEEIRLGAATQEHPNGFSLTVKVNVLNILEESYKWFGLIDYFLVFRGITSEQCSDVTKEDCWNITVEYWPSTMRTMVLTGTREEISQDLAVVILRGALRVRDDAWRKKAPLEATPPYLMATDIPENMAELEATAKGIEIIRTGESHSECIGKSKMDCLTHAREILNTTIGASQGSKPKYTTVGAYGLALVEIDAAVRAARRLEPSQTVLQHLQNAKIWTQRAITSEFLSANLTDNYSVESMTEFLKLSDLKPSVALIALVKRFSCALTHHRQANWEMCISMLGDIREFPPPLRLYLESARLDASLNRLDGEEFLNTLARTLQVLEDVKDDGRRFKLGLIVIEHTCKQHDHVNDKNFFEIAMSTMQNAPEGNETALHETVIQASGCRANQSFPTVLQLAEARDYVDKLFDDEMERGRLWFLLFKYYIRKNQLDDALEAAINTFHLPWARFHLKKTKEYKTLINSEYHRNKYNEKSSKVKHRPAFVDLDNCIERGETK